MEFELRQALADGHALKLLTGRLPEKLEEKFLNETGAERDRQIRFWIGCYLCFNLLAYVVDVFSMPDVWLLALLMRLGVMLPVALLAMQLLARPGPPWRRSAAAITSLSVNLLALMVIFAASAAFSAFRSELVLLLMVVWVNVLIPLRLRDTVIYSVVTVFLGDLINAEAAALHQVDFVLLDVVVCFHVLAALSIFARSLGERQSRRSFVLGLRLRIQAEDLARSNASLVKMSNTDPLTGLANRRAFDLALAQASAAAELTQSPLAVMMIDVDHFKLFNDAAGHIEGDRCLTIVARAIADHVRRDHDFVARFGGEEFVVLMQSTGLDEAQEIAERVHTAVGALRLFHPAAPGGSFVTVSIGVAATLSEPAMIPSSELLATADQALYAAKSAGRNRVVRAGLRTRNPATAA